MRENIMYFWVGILVIIATLASMFLVYQVSGFSVRVRGERYQVLAHFGNIGSLKVKAPVRIAGVTVGAINDIQLDNSSFQAKVSMQISTDVKLPIDSSARILTEGLLGGNYIELTPGFEDKTIANGGAIADTKSAIMLENLVSKLMYK